MTNYTLDVVRRPEFEWLGSSWSATLTTGVATFRAWGKTAKIATKEVFEAYLLAVREWVESCEEEEETIECFDCGQFFSSFDAYQNHFETVWGSYYDPPEEVCTYDEFDEVDL